MSGPNLPYSAGPDPHRYAATGASALHLDDSQGAHR